MSAILFVSLNRWFSRRNGGNILTILHTTCVDDEPVTVYQLHVHFCLHVVIRKSLVKRKRSSLVRQDFCRSNFATALEILLSFELNIKLLCAVSYRQNWDGKA